MTPEQLADRARRNLEAWLPPRELAAHFAACEPGSPADALLCAYRLAWSAYHEALLGDPANPADVAWILALDAECSGLCLELCNLVTTVGRRDAWRRRRPRLSLILGGVAA